LKGELNNLEIKNNFSPQKVLTSEQKKERAIIALAACIGAILGILAYNFGWLG
jgi:hypothetical protein